MTPETFARYANRNLPRYTSYPTAPHFSAAVDGRVYGDWLRGVQPGTDLSLYVHVPFCRAMCWYCGCHTSVTARSAPIAAYLRALELEIAKVAAILPESCLVRHVHFGGGTPTLMAPTEFVRLMDALRRHFRIARDAEIAVEVDPRALAPEMAAAIADAGVGRASLGVQTFDATVQRAINRVQDFATVETAVSRLRDAGIGAISFDLIYGLPHQTAQSCRETVAQALRLAPDRLAVFGYAHVPGFKPHQRKIDAAALPGAGERWAQALAIDQEMVGAGYARIGLDHYARPGDSLAVAARTGALHRNFQGYTTDDCPVLIGLGASAIGKSPQGFVQNVAGTGDYRRRVESGLLAAVRGYRLSDEDRLRGALIERLMCDLEVDVAAICARFGGDPQALVDTLELDTLEADGLIVRDGAVIAMTEAGRPLVRAVATVFDAYLGQGPALHSRAA